MAPSSQRLSLTEYGEPLSFAAVSATVTMPVVTLREHLRRASRRIAESLAVYDAVAFGDGVFQVNDVAGILRLCPGVELEVKPKFLSGEKADWREDFFFIAMVSKYGRVLPRESLASESAERGDLSDLIARAMIQMYEENRRRPLRVYRRRTWESFFLDGEVDFETIALPDEDGFRQQGLVLDRENQFNRVIHRGMSNLLPEVRDGDTRRKLAHTILQTSPQNDRNRVRAKGLPARHRRWQDLYHLALRVLSGHGLAYGDLGYGPLPGFLVRTSETWESLLLTALRIGLPDRHVTKRSHRIGIRTQPGRAPAELSVEPDITIENAGSCSLVVDAKYKVGADCRPGLCISRADVYESLAFMRATNCKRAVLLYPSAEPSGATGATAAVDRVVVDAFEIVGLTVDPRGIARPGGFGLFSRRLADSVRAYECPIGGTA